MQQYMEILKTAKHMSIKYSIHFHKFIEIDTLKTYQITKKNTGKHVMILIDQNKLTIHQEH